MQATNRHTRPATHAQSQHLQRLLVLAASERRRALQLQHTRLHALNIAYVNEANIGVAAKPPRVRTEGLDGVRGTSRTSGAGSSHH